MLNDKIIDSLKVEACNVWPQDWKGIKAISNKICRAVSIDILINRFGLFPHKNDFNTFSDIKQKIQSFKDSDYILDKLFEILCEEKILAKKNKGFIRQSSYIEVENSSELLTSAVNQFPDEGIFFQWLARSTGKMQDFIEGKVFGEEVLFPYGSFDLIEKFYNISKVYRYYPRIAAKAAKIIIHKYNKQVSILEIGAGTGNGTRILFNEIEHSINKIKKYTFSDINKSFVRNAKKKFLDFNFIEYKDFDLNNSPQTHNIKKEAEDIVYGVNALHATKDLQASCEIIYSILKKEGHLIIGELSPPPEGIYRHMELTFGMLKSFYDYNDKSFRPSSPFIRPAKWVEVLKKSGFSEVKAIPGENSRQCETGGVIIAKK